jgi:hypothetical protein
MCTVSHFPVVFFQDGFNLVEPFCNDSVSALQPRQRTRTWGRLGSRSLFRNLSENLAGEGRKDKPLSLACVAEYNEAPLNVV